MSGGNPVDAMSWAMATFGARYFELYTPDVDAAVDAAEPWLEGLTALGQSLCATEAD